jgi:hypothetical protein
MFFLKYDVKMNFSEDSEFPLLQVAKMGQAANPRQGRLLERDYPSQNIIILSDFILKLKYH